MYAPSLFTKREEMLTLKGCPLIFNTNRDGSEKREHE